MLLFSCAVIVLCVAWLIGVDTTTTFHIGLQSKWEFTAKHLRENGPDSFHMETSVLRVGPIEFDYTHHISSGPVILLQTIAAGNQREIDIFAQHICAKENQSTVLLYCVWERSRQVQYGTFCFGRLVGATNGLQFDLITSQDGGLIGVTERKDPNVVLILRDFSSGFDWPGTTQRYWEVNKGKAESLIVTLAQENHLGKLALESSSQSNRIAGLQRINTNE